MYGHMISKDIGNSQKGWKNQTFQSQEPYTYRKIAFFKSYPLPFSMVSHYYQVKHWFIELTWKKKAGQLLKVS